MDGKKIIVIGCCGGGKSYFAKELSKIIGVPCFHLDNIYWKPNWVRTPREEFRSSIASIMEKDEWIIDGNYGSTMEDRIQKADLAFFMDMPSNICLENEAKRRGTKRSDFPDYLEEKEDLEFIEFIKNFNSNGRNIILNLFEKYPKIKVISFTSKESVDKYLKNCKR